MTSAHGNRGDRVGGVRYATVDPRDDMAAFDRLPRRLRRLLANAPARLNSQEVLERLRGGKTPARLEVEILLGIKGFLDNANRETEQW